MFGITARLDAHLDPDDILAQLGLDDGGRVQQIIDQRVIDFSLPYVPASPDRTLEFSAQVSTEVGRGLVVWNTPYARYQYYGFVMTDDAGRTWVGPGETKPVVTDRPLTYDTSQNPMAGARWFDRMKADRLNDILDEARKAIGG